MVTELGEPQKELKVIYPKSHQSSMLKRSLALGLACPLWAGAELHPPPPLRRGRRQLVAFESTYKMQTTRDPPPCGPSVSDSMIKSSPEGRLQTPGWGPQLSSGPGLPGFCLQAWLAEVEGRLPARSEQARRQSGLYDAQSAPTVNNCAQARERYRTDAALCSGRRPAPLSLLGSGVCK